MNTILFSLSIVCVCLFLLVFIMFTALYRTKVRNQRKKAQKNRWIGQHQTAIDRLLRTGEAPQEIIPKTSFDFEVLEEELVRKTRNDTASLKHIHSFIRTCFFAYYKKRLAHSKESVRMESLFYIDYFQLTELKDDLLKLLEKSHLSRQETYQIYFTLAVFSPEEVLNKLISGNERFPLFVRRRLLETILTETVTLSVMKEFHHYPLELQESILEILRNKHERSVEFLTLLESLLRNVETLSASRFMELRVQMWKAVEGFGYFPETALIADAIPYAKQEPERMMLARVMGSIRKEEFIPYLEDMLADTSYLVRNEAAHSISKYREGTSYLQRIVTFHPDRFARDIAAEWLERSLYEY